MQKCPKHPKYLSLRKPRADCSHCHEMYAAELKAREAAEEKERNKSKNANYYLEVVAIFKKLDNVGPYWKMDADLSNKIQLDGAKENTII